MKDKIDHAEDFIQSLDMPIDQKIALARRLIYDAFPWHDSPQGDDYWFDVCGQLEAVQQMYQK